MADLWSTARRSPTPISDGDVRTDFEIDFDRLLFSTPVRRLADKTQVFPLEKNDGVRTRLTHSNEVSNLARSMGQRLIRLDENVFGDTDEIRNAAPVILASSGLAHDLGNPPFGHQGEAAIGRWFTANDKLFDEYRVEPRQKDSDKFSPVPSQSRGDFLKFEGNAQTIRLVARLQNTSGPHGLNLTAATLAAMMKYSVPSSTPRNSSAATKKFGYFASEADVFEWVSSETGVGAGQRHPLAWIMEASDDTAYSVLDVEDAMRKQLVSPEDSLAFLRRRFRTGALSDALNELDGRFEKADASGASLSRAAEIKASYLRTRLIDFLVRGATASFLEDQKAIRALTREAPLLESGTEASDLYKALKEFARAHAYVSQPVLRSELEGAVALDKIMTCFWRAITDRESFSEMGSRRRTPQSAYAYALISESYKWAFEHSAPSTSLPIRYLEMQLLTDMMSGMTDSFAMEMAAKLKPVIDG
jgi:dGTPase